MSQSPVYIGTDVSKDYLDIHGPSLQRRFSNSPKGFSQIIKAIPSDGHVVMEATGGYEGAFVQALHAAGVKVSILNPRNVRDFAKSMGQLAKTDKIDAAMIARFAAIKCPTPDAPPSKSQQRLAEMVRRREQLLEMRVAEANRLQHHSAPAVRKQGEKMVKLIKQQIEELEKLIASEIAGDMTLNRKFERICEADGIGPIVGAAVLAHLPELGSISRNQAAALLGVAPFACDSGSVKGQRKIYGGRFAARSAIYMAALSSARKNPFHKALFQRLRAAGKPFKLAIVAVMRKLIILLNHLLANPDFVLVK